MKSMEDLYNEILRNEELKRSFIEAAKDNRLVEFLRENGCGATREEAVAFLKEKRDREGTVSDAELESVAGGCGKSERIVSSPTLGYSFGICG